MAPSTSTPKTTEVWARNPEDYMAHVRTADLTGTVFHKQPLYDPWQACRSVFPKAVDWRAIVVDRFYALEISARHSTANPRAWYPVWRYGVDSIRELERMMADGWTYTRDEVKAARKMVTTPPSDLPSRVFVTGMPQGNYLGFNDKFFAVLHQLQVRYPDTIAHIHNVDDSVAFAFGTSVRSVDFDFGEFSDSGMIVLANGKRIEPTTPALLRYETWIKLLGFSVKTFNFRQSNVIDFNIAALRWAGNFWNNTTAYRVKVNSLLTPDDARMMVSGKQPDPGVIYGNGNNGRSKNYRRLTMADKYSCDSCSLSPRCREYRVGSICTLSTSPASELAKYFETRDATVVMDGLAKLMAEQATRYSEGREREMGAEEHDEHVSKMLDALFKNGVQFAKLVDPSLRTSAVSVNIDNSKNQVNVVTSGDLSGNYLTAAAVEELEAAGIDRGEITVEMVRQVIAGNSREVIAAYKQQSTRQLAAASVPASMPDDDSVVDADIVDED